VRNNIYITVLACSSCVVPHTSKIIKEERN